MEAPASSRCPLRRLSSQAVGCRRPPLSPWLGHRLSGSLWKAWVMAACLHAAAPPQLNGPVHSRRRMTACQMHFLLGARKKPGPVGPGAVNTCDPKSEEALSFLQGDPTFSYLWGKQNQRDREVEGQRQSVCPNLQTSLRNQWRYSSLQLRELSSLKVQSILQSLEKLLQKHPVPGLVTGM